MASCDTPTKRTRLATRARIAYELGGLLSGLAAAAPVLPLALLSIGCCGLRKLPLVLGALLFFSTVALVSASRELGRAARLGLHAGALCAALPMTFKLLHLCSGLGCKLVLPFCLYGGLLAGALVGYRTGRLESGRPRFLAVSGALTVLAGAIGCTQAGLAGVCGMALGMLGASTPFLLVARAR